MALLSMLYSLAAYAFFLATMGYAVGFVGNLPGLPVTIDRAQQAPLVQALAIDLALIGVFAIQHSVMARRSVKERLGRLVHPSIERSTFVVAASASLALLMWQWRGIPEPVLWSVDHPLGRLALQALAWSGWGLVVLSSYLIDHFELFGLRQPWARLKGLAPAPAQFRTPLLYRRVRHPLYLGFVVAFWATPVMTAGHAVFALGQTAYILVGVWFEERDLIRAFGHRYVDYRQRVGMLLPRLRR